MENQLSHSPASSSATDRKINSPADSLKSKPYDICFQEGQPSTMGKLRSAIDDKEQHVGEQVGEKKSIILRPGMVLLKQHLTHEEQVGVVKNCREMGLGPGGFYQPGFTSGARLRLKMMCLGLDWNPQTPSIWTQKGN